MYVYGASCYVHIMNERVQGQAYQLINQYVCVYTQYSWFPEI